jgi:anti-sigma regulatory factor (Ser/Thr protein kinase)
MKNDYEEQFIIENRIEELSALAQKIEQLGEKWDLLSPVTMKINLVLEEALSNIIYYAFEDNEIHKIEILLKNQDNMLTIEIIDDGIPFDPLSHEQPDITLQAEERPVGGLGIFLISKIMDTVQYSRINNFNILTLKKNIE